MPYLILIIGLIIAFYAFSKFFVNAKPDEVQFMMGNICFAIVGCVILFLAMTGRLGAGLMALIMFLPMWMKFFRKPAPRKPQPKKPAPVSTTMTESEALEVLGLESGASTDDIQDAYKKLMQKVHPDNQGTDWMAAKLNQARDTLLNKA